MRLAITAFIAGGSLLLFLNQVPENWIFIGTGLCLICLLMICFTTRKPFLKELVLLVLFFVMGFTWNAQYAKSRLSHILPIELDGKEFILEGRVSELPQSDASSAKFAFEVSAASAGKDVLEAFPKRVYLSWQPAWRKPHPIPVIIPGQLWKIKAKLKRPYGTLNPFAFDFERWSFHQDFGAIGSVRTGELLINQAISWYEFKLHMELARWHLRKKIQSMLPRDARYVGVLVALVMGDQNAINQDDWRVFNATGIGHLISIKYKIYLSLKG